MNLSFLGVRLNKRNCWVKNAFGWSMSGSKLPTTNSVKTIGVSKGNPVK